MIRTLNSLARRSTALTVTSRKVQFGTAIVASPTATVFLANIRAGQLIRFVSVVQIALCSWFCSISAKGVEPCSVAQALELISPERPESTRLQALFWLRDRGPSAASAQGELLNLATNLSEPIFLRICAAKTLGSIGRAAQPSTFPLARLIGSSTLDPALRISYVSALGSIGPAAAEAVPALTNILAAMEFDLSLGRECAVALGRIGDIRALPVLKKSLNHRELQLEAAEAISLLNANKFDSLIALGNFLIETNRPLNAPFDDSTAECFVRIAEVSEIGTWSPKQLQIAHKLLNAIESRFQGQPLLLLSSRIRAADAAIKSEINRKAFHITSPMITLACWIIVVVLGALYWVPASRSKPVAVAELIATVEAFPRVEIKGFCLPIGQIVSLAFGFALARAFPKVRHQLLVIHRRQ